MYSQDGRGDAARVVVKFFATHADWRWYVIEGEEQPDGDWWFFALYV